MAFHASLGNGREKKGNLVTSKMVLHVAVLQVVELRKAEAQRVIAELVAALEITARLYYRATPTAWEDAFVVCEGEGEQVDSFIESLREHSNAAEQMVGGASTAGDRPPLIRGLFLLARQWTYPLFSDEGGATHEPTARHLGPPGLRGGEYETMCELGKGRLAKLQLGCNWDELIIAAQLNAILANRKEPPEQSAERLTRRKTKRGSGTAAALVGRRVEKLAIGDGR